MTAPEDQSGTVVAKHTIAFKGAFMPFYSITT